MLKKGILKKGIKMKLKLSLQYHAGVRHRVKNIFFRLGKSLFFFTKVEIIVACIRQTSVYNNKACLASISSDEVAFLPILFMFFF